MGINIKADTVARLMELGIPNVLGIAGKITNMLFFMKMAFVSLTATIIMLVVATLNFNATGWLLVYVVWPLLFASVIITFIMVMYFLRLISIIPIDKVRLAVRILRN